jgi:two-component system, OmpR family, catabolic regulation response regulator CreB
MKSSQPSSAANSSGAPCVLVVEDEPSIRDNILWALESEGFRAVACATLQAAREALAAETPALMLLDIGLPDGHGFDFCRELRRTSNLPVIFLTARDGEVDRIVGLEIGADDYITKPFSPREVTARVRAVLRRITGTAVLSAACAAPARESLNDDNANDPPVIRGAVRGFVVDEMRCAISFCGRVLDLSRYEFRLLKTLIAHPHRVFSRAQLMDHAWEEPDASLERTVDSHIKSLRAKLREVDAAFQPIRTHRGLGYSLNPEAD